MDKIETKFIEDEGNCIIMGDLNGRTKMGEDFVRDQSDKYSPINNPSYIKDVILEGRQNLDEHTIDEQGKLILSLCKSSALRILNGRTPGDECGRFTRYPSNITDKPSVIDYALCSERIIEEVKSLFVLPFNGLSDHCCISLTITSNIIHKGDISTPVSAIKNDDNLDVSKFKFMYDKTRRQDFEQALREETNVNELKALFTQPNLNCAVVD